MRLSVDGGGYTTAARAFCDANHLAALVHDSQGGKLAGFAGMAGDDATSTEFAAAYDETVAEGLAALGDLVGAFTGLGRLTEQSLSNHLKAEARSVIAGAVVFDGSAVARGSYVSVLPVTPPTALGGDSPHLPEEVTWILDRVQGFAWPNADTSVLRDAAHVWRSAAEDVDRLTDYCSAAAAGLESQRSPEVPLALAAIADLSRAVRDLSGQYATVADSCDTYAARVDAKRDEILALVREVLAMVVEGIVISVAIGLITAGAGTLASGSAVAARVAAQSPRFTAIPAALRRLSAAGAARLRGAHAGVRATRARLERFLRVPARNEVGSFTVVGGHRWQKGWLSAHEHSGSHTLSRHVGKTDRELLERLQRQPSIRGSSSFSDQGTAERAVAQVIDEHYTTVGRWLKSEDATLRLSGQTDWVVGRHASPMGELSDAHAVRVLVARDGSMPGGYRVVTAYPLPG